MKTFSPLFVAYSKTPCVVTNYDVLSVCKCYLCTFDDINFLFFVSKLAKRTHFV